MGIENVEETIGKLRRQLGREPTDEKSALLGTNSSVGLMVR